MLDDVNKLFVFKSKMNHSDTEQPVQCNKFFTEKGLVHHEKIVHNRTLNCSVCDKAFGKKSGLEHHIKMVHGEKNHKCALCNDAFPTGGLWSF